MPHGVLQKFKPLGNNYINKTKTEKTNYYAPRFNHNNINPDKNRFNKDNKRKNECFTDWLAFVFFSTKNYLLIFRYNFLKNRIKVCKTNTAIAITTLDITAASNEYFGTFPSKDTPLFPIPYKPCPLYMTINTQYIMSAIAHLTMFTSIKMFVNNKKAINGTINKNNASLVTSDQSKKLGKHIGNTRNCKA